MPRIRLLNFAVWPLLLSCGCAHMSNTDKGALAGAGLGTAGGAAIGSATGHTGAGAAIGGVLGTIGGALTGAAIDESEQKAEARLAAATAPPPQGPLRLEDVASLAQQHVNDGVIIQQIRTTGSAYHLTPAQIVWLKQNGVSDAVVQEMQATALRPPRRVYSAEPAYYAQPVYVVQPPPPVSVGFGFGYSRFRCR